MADIRHLARDIVAREGGFVDDPDDPGGATNHGVTIHTLRRLRLDLTGDGQVDAEDVRRLTQAQAVDLFIAEYWHRPGIDRLPAALQPVVFDMQVNAGANAVRLLQRLMRDMGQPVTVDGLIGPQTVRAAALLAAAAPHHLVDAYAIARRDYYLALADARPASRKFARTRAGGKGGWVRRAEEFLHPRYHLTAAAFRERTAAWD